jgi:hypothetical protein
LCEVKLLRHQAVWKWINNPPVQELAGFGDIKSVAMKKYYYLLYLIQRYNAFAFFANNSLGKMKVCKRIIP